MQCCKVLNIDIFEHDRDEPDSAAQAAEPNSAPQAAEPQADHTAQRGWSTCCSDGENNGRVAWFVQSIGC